MCFTGVRNEMERCEEATRLPDDRAESTGASSGRPDLPHGPKSTRGATRVSWCDPKNQLPVGTVNEDFEHERLGSSVAGTTACRWRVRPGSMLADDGLQDMQTAGHGVQARGHPQGSESCGDTAELQGSGTVSYTHLTLPTKDGV